MKMKIKYLKHLRRFELNYTKIKKYYYVYKKSEYYQKYLSKSQSLSQRLILSSGIEIFEKTCNLVNLCLIFSSTISARTEL